MSDLEALSERSVPAAPSDAGQGDAVRTAGDASASAPVVPRLIVGQFEGPLDLLLHLIRTSEIAIADIPIVQVCRQYDQYLSLMRELNLEIAGDYIVMAATLTHIKSRMLLPAPPAAPGEAIEDPRADLVRQLVEYQRIKAAAEALRDLDEAAADGFERGNAGEDPLGPWRGEKLLEVSLFDLLGAFRRLLDALGDAAPLRVQREEISVAEKIAWILDRLEETPTLSFQTLIHDLPARAERIAAFLAVLELVRLRLVRAAQHRSGAEILLIRSAEEEETPAGEGDAVAVPLERRGGDDAS